MRPDDQATRAAFEAELAEALAAEDVAAELDAVAARHAAEPPRAERVAELRELHAGLGALRERIDAARYTGPAWAPPAEQAGRPGAIRWALTLGSLAAAALLLIAVLDFAARVPATPPAAPPPGEVAVAEPEAVPTTAPQDDAAATVSVASAAWPADSMSIGSFAMPTDLLAQVTLPTGLWQQATTGGDERSPATQGAEEGSVDHGT